MNEIGFKPKLYPDCLPFMHLPIHGCSCGAFSGIEIKDGKRFHMSSVVLHQDREGWFQVTCLECFKESIRCANPDDAVHHWNDENPSDKPMSEVELRNTRLMHSDPLPTPFKRKFGEFNNYSVNKEVNPINQLP
jgi:hypothetical protein